MDGNFPYNKTKYYRANHDEDNPFTVISNVIVKNADLSILEKGLMLYLLSNSDSYIINKSVIIKQSGHGRKAIDKAFKNLEAYGYIQYMYKNNVHTWIINENPDYCSKSNVTKVTSLKYNHLSDSTKVSSQLEQVINNKEKSSNEENTNRKNINIESNNETSPTDLSNSSVSLEEISDVSHTSNNLEKQELSTTSSQVTNDLNLIISNCKKFKGIYDSNTHWNVLDISDYSNAIIAHHVIVGKREDNYSTLKKDEYYLFLYLVKYSSTVDGSILWEEFTNQCRQEDILSIIPELDAKND